MINYISTRGPGAPRSFSDVLLSGMAPDGGLYIPESWPSLSAGQLAALTGKPYSDMAAAIMYPFVADILDKKDFHKMAQKTYEGGAFHHQAVAPLQQVDSALWLMELFHGPTLSFKDYALQLLGRLFDHVLEERGERITIVGATSGDTGSAAIDACRNCKNVDIFILHPQGRTSEIQRKQMTTASSENVHNIALKGNFDDCQSLVKALFADQEMRKELGLSAVNSINWARIMAQTVYYVAAALALGGTDNHPVSFTVPTGNFGNIYAAWAARKMGAPIGDLVVASNRNDILTRFFESGSMDMQSVVPSLSPSMDIQISSNFERFLCDLMGRDHEALSDMMESFKNTGHFAVENALIDKARAEFASYRCNDEQTLAAMRDCYMKTGIQLDPHTAVAYHAARQHQKEKGTCPLVFLGCAHPAKFPEAVEKATGRAPDVPARLKAAMTGQEHYDVLDNDAQTVKAHIYKKARC